MTQALIVLLSALAGGLLFWALSLRRRVSSLPGEREAIERRRAELLEEEAAAVEEAKEKTDEAKKLDLVDWLRRFARGRDPGDR